MRDCFKFLQIGSHIQCMHECNINFVVKQLYTNSMSYIAELMYLRDADAQVSYKVQCIQLCVCPSFSPAMNLQGQTCTRDNYNSLTSAKLPPKNEDGQLKFICVDKKADKITYELKKYTRHQNYGSTGGDDYSTSKSCGKKWLREFMKQ